MSDIHKGQLKTTVNMTSSLVDLSMKLGKQANPDGIKLTHNLRWNIHAKMLKRKGVDIIYTHYTYNSPLYLIIESL